MSFFFHIVSIPSPSLADLVSFAFSDFGKLKSQRRLRFLCGRFYIGKWIDPKTFCLYCICNSAFFTGGMRRVLIIYCGVASFLFTFGVVGRVRSRFVGACNRDGRSMMEEVLLNPPLGRRAKFCGKRVSLHFCGVFGLGGTTKFLERLRDWEVARFNASLWASVPRLFFFCNYDLGLVLLD